MTLDDYTSLLEHPEHIDASQALALRDVVRAFPFFQSARALHLKGLKNQESFAYNKALKRTAIHTTDRAVLFDFITSAHFLQNEVSNSIKDQEKKLLSITVNEQEDISLLLDHEEQEKASKILDPDLFIEKEDSTMTQVTPEETLQLGKPLAFTKAESHSFSQWLQLSSFKPINRGELEVEDTKEQASKEEREPQEKFTPPIKKEEEITLSRKRKQQIIDSFIDSNPKIQISKGVSLDKKPMTREHQFSSESLMTETLARVYVEQKNYKKAKQAYRILILKYPEKSGFFADQIWAVEQLEE